MLALIVASAAVGGWRAASAQPPGTSPPKQVFDEGDEPQGLPFRAFMLQSETGNKIMVPSLTWEELQRLQDLDAGMNSARRPYSFQSLAISGTAERERAELEVDLKVMVEPTEGRWVQIPLRMGNFFCVAHPDVTGAAEFRVNLAPDDSGYLLLVKTGDKQTDVNVKMRVAARVENSSSVQTLSFRLPDVPSTVVLTTDADNVTGEVVGRGDEAIETERTQDNQTEFTVNCGGGTFSIRWGRLSQSNDDLPLFEVESRVRVDWDSPQDQPIVDVGLTVVNVRGSISSFRLRLPAGTLVREPPFLGVRSGPRVELGTATSDRLGEIREVIIPLEERAQRINLGLELQLANDNASATSPLEFRVPEVVGALRHRGTIEVRTGGDYRLRWRATPWIRSELGESPDEVTAGRTYRFRFDRTSFELRELPLWLGKKERQLRMNSSSEISIIESIASLDMTVQVTGQTADGRLHFDDAAWTISSIEDLETGEALESFQSESVRIIEFNADGREEPAPIRIRAEHTLESGEGKAQFKLPRVVPAGDKGLVQSATVDIINGGRSMLVVDLDASTGLSRALSSMADTSDSPISSFRVISQEEPAMVVGTLIDQPPRITLSSSGTVEIDGRQLLTTVNWTVLTGLDLEGRLPIRIPFSSLSPTLIPAVAPDSSDTSSDDQGDGSTGVANQPLVMPNVAHAWRVTVNGVESTLRHIEDDHYELVSDRLTSGSMAIRWQQAQNLEINSLSSSIETVSLPRPDIADVTERGAVAISFQGSQQLELTSVDSPGVSRIELERLPRDPLRLRLESKLTAREELSIRKMVLRTMVGRNTRFEQVLATIQGGENFQVGLPESARGELVEAFIDRKPRPVRRDGNRLVLTLPSDNEPHDIDLRVWLSHRTSSALARVQPTLDLPLNAGQVVWQVIAPSDGHAIWAAPTLGRLMTWRFGRWQIERQPNVADQALLGPSIGTPLVALPPGNRYLYVGSDLRSFQVLLVSRVVLWVFVGSFVLMTSVLLTNFPQMRHPMTAVAGAVLFTGLITVAPDAAVLAGQFGIVALVLVILMTAVRVMIQPRQGDRVFSTRTASATQSPSTRSQRPPVVAESVSGTSTETLPAPSPTEATP